jgi:nitrate/nitrite transporter NarK
MTGVAAAGGLALINSVGQLGGVIGPYMVGLVEDATGSADAALYAIAGVCGLSAVLISWCLPERVYAREPRPSSATAGLAHDGMLVPNVRVAERD